MNRGKLTLRIAGAAAALEAARRARARLRLSRAKHASLAGHSRLAKRIAGLVPDYAFDRRAFFRADDLPAAIAARREAGFERLAALYRERFARTAAYTASIRDAIPSRSLAFAQNACSFGPSGAPSSSIRSAQ